MHRAFFLPILVSIAACSSASSVSEVQFHGEQQPLPDFKFDTGLQPPGSPVQMQVSLSAAGGLAVDATAFASGSADAPILTGKIGSGKLAMNVRFAFDAKLRADVPGVPKYDGPIPGVEKIDIHFGGETPFDPFLIDGKASVTSDIPETKLPPIPLPGGIPGTLVITIARGSTLTSDFSGVCAAVQTGLSGMQATYLGKTITHGTLKLVPAIQIAVPLVGMKTFMVPAVDVAIPPTTAMLDLGSKPIASFGSDPPKELAGSIAMGMCSPPAPSKDAAVEAAVMMDAGVIDAALDSIDADANVPVFFDAKTVPGLAVWLLGGMGITQNAGHVSQWADQSGKGNHAVQNDKTHQPLWVASSINGQPGVGFKRTSPYQLTMKDTGSLQWDNRDFLIEIVARHTTPQPSIDGVGCLYSKLPSFGTGPSLFVNTYPASINDPSGSGFMGWLDSSRKVFSTKTGLANGSPHAFAVHRAGSTLELRLDGVVIGTTVASVTSVSAWLSDVRIGSESNGGSSRLEGEIDEIIAVGQTVSAGDLSAIESYLVSKYNL